MNSLNDVRLMLAPSSGVSLSGTTVPKMALALTAHPVAIEGAAMRIVFYDRDIFMASKLYKAEGGTLQYFTEPGWGQLSNNTVLDPADLNHDWGSPADPKVDKGSGVLLVLEGFLRHMTGKFASNPANFAFEIQTKKEYHGPSVGTVELWTMDERGRAGPVANINLRADEGIDFTKPRQLLVRAVMIDAGGGLNAREVYASSLNVTWEKDKAIRFELNSLAIDRPLANGTTPPPGSPAPTPSPSPPSPTSRVLTPDLTGYYEAFIPGKSSPLTMFVHQAGYAVVGWFQPPPNGLTTPKNPPSLPAEYPQHAGTFVSTRAPNDKKWRMTWRLSPSKYQNDGDPFDPDPGNTAKAGWIELTPGPLPNDGMQTLTFTFESGGVATPVVMNRVRPGETRWPWAVLQQVQPDKARAIEVDDATKPIPTSYFDEAAETLSEHNQALVDAITKHEATTKPADRALYRTVISNILSSVIPGDATTRARFGRRLPYILYTNGITIGTTRLGGMDWLARIVNEYKDYLKLANPDWTDKQVTDFINTQEPIWSAAHVPIEGSFVYSLIIDKFPATANTSDFNIDKRMGFGLAGSAFHARVKKEIVQGNTRTVPPDWKDWESHDFYGGWASFGAGLGTTGLAGKTGSAGSGISTIEFATYQDLAPADFQFGYFTVAAIDGPKVSAPVLGSFNIFSSSFVQLYLDTVELDAVVTETWKYSEEKWDLSTFVDGIKDPQKFKDKYLQPKGSLTLFNLSMGGGFFFAKDTLSRPIQPPSHPQDDPTKVKPVQTSMYFDRDSGILGLDQRQGLEQVLAACRKFWVEKDSYAQARAFTSPEQTRPYNQVLSDARAAAVKQAVLDAFGDGMAVKSFESIGFGEDPSVNEGGLLDPPDSPAGLRALSAEDRKRLSKEQQEIWPLWRRVDLWVSGMLVARIGAH